MQRSPEAQAKLEAARERIAGYLLKIEDVFLEPVKVTLVVRNPAYPDGSRDLLLTSDKLPEMRRALDMLEQKERE